MNQGAQKEHPDFAFCNPKMLLVLELTVLSIFSFC